MLIFIIILAALLLTAAAVLFLPIPLCVRLLNSELSLKLFNMPYIMRRGKDVKTKQKEIKQKEQIRFEDIKRRISAGRKLYKETKPSLKLLLNRLFKVAKVVYYRAVVTMGFEDPMNTGMAVGVAGAFFTELNSFFYGLLSPSKESYLSAVPNFNESGLNFAAEIKLHISLFNALMFMKELSSYKKNNQDGLNIIFGGIAK